MLGNTSSKYNILSKIIVIIWRYVLSIIINEIKLTWNLLHDNLLADVVPTLIFTITAWNLLGRYVEMLPVSLGLGLLFGFLYSYSFDITQQILSISEDKINKPNRPIVNGQLSIRGAYVRCVIIHIVFFTFGLIFDILIYVVMWQIVSLFYKFSKYWIYKNFFISVGTISMLAGSWELVGELPQEVLIWITVIAINLFFIAPLQDLRDVKGDISIGRKTFPIVFGIQKTRYYIAILYIVSNPLLHHLYFFTLGNDEPIVLLSEVLLSSLSIYIGLRILLKKSRQADKLSYTLLVCWYISLLICANLIFTGIITNQSGS